MTKVWITLEDIGRFPPFSSGLHRIRKVEPADQESTGRPKNSSIVHDGAEWAPGTRGGQSPLLGVLALPPLAKQNCWSLSVQSYATRPKVWSFFCAWNAAYLSVSGRYHVKKNFLANPEIVNKLSTTQMSEVMIAPHCLC